MAGSGPWGTAGPQLGRPLGSCGADGEDQEQQEGRDWVSPALATPERRLPFLGWFL